MRLVIDLNVSSCTLHFFNRIGTFYLYLISSLAVFSVIFVYIAAAHATCVELELYVSTISHISNA